MLCVTSRYYFLNCKFKITYQKIMTKNIFIKFVLQWTCTDQIYTQARQFSCSATFPPTQATELFCGFSKVFFGLVTIETSFLYFGKPVSRQRSNTRWVNTIWLQIRFLWKRLEIVYFRFSSSFYWKIKLSII